MLPIRTRIRSSMLLAVILTTLVGQPARADHYGSAYFRSERVYFSCDGGQPKIANAGRALGAIPGWTTRAPTSSVQNGTGCAYADSGAVRATDGPTWEGTFTGNLNAIVVDLHHVAPQVEVYSEIAMDITLTVDGEPFAFYPSPVEVRPDDGLFEVVQSLRFALTNLAVVDDPEGFGDVEHTYRFGIRAHYVDSGAAVAILWGATEFPSGLTFNGTTSGMPRFRA